MCFAENVIEDKMIIVSKYLLLSIQKYVLTKDYFIILLLIKYYNNLLVIYIYLNERNKATKSIKSSCVSCVIEP